MKPLLLVPLLIAQLGCKDAGGRTEDPPDSTPQFDGAKAHELLRAQVAFGPRVPGTSGHRRQLRWMVDYLRPKVDTVDVQRFTHVGRTGRVDMANVFARVRADLPDRILLVAHWDTRPMADQEPDPERADQPVPGANDGASGTAVLLQLADVLSRHSPPVGVDLLFVDGEDYGPGEMYLGSTQFAANMPPGYRPLYAIVIDMVGDENPRFAIESYSQEGAPEVVDRVWRTAEGLGLGAMFPRTEGMAVEDDHIPLQRAGLRAIDIIDFDYPYWHTLDDTVAHTRSTGLEAVGRVLTTLIFRGG